MKIILIILILIILYYILNKYNNDNFTNLKSNIWNINLNPLPWNINSNNPKLDYNPNLNLKPSTWNNQICGNNKNLTEINNNNILMAYNYDNIQADDTKDICNNYNNIDSKYNQDDTKLRLAIDNHNIFTNIKYENKEYNLLGYANNKYYNQKYFIYESLNNNNIENVFISNNLEYINNQQYNYALVKITDNKVLYVFGPRDKININDIVNLSYGVFQIGPLEIIKI